MQMQPQNARSCPRCTQCVKEAWYSREAMKKNIKSKQGMSTTKTPSLDASLKMMMDRLERVLIIIFGGIEMVSYLSSKAKETGPVNNPLRLLLLGAALAGSTTHLGPSSSQPSRRTFDAF
jgi:hypothetical protein